MTHWAPSGAQGQMGYSQLTGSYWKRRPDSQKIMEKKAGQGRPCLVALAPLGTRALFLRQWTRTQHRTNRLPTLLLRQQMEPRTWGLPRAQRQIITSV